MVDIILCQSAVRRCAAIKERSMLWDALCTRSATTIQTSWRTCSAKASYFRIRSNVILLESIIRRWKTERHLQKLKGAITKVMAYWRMYHCRKNHKQNVKGKSELLEVLTFFIFTRPTNTDIFYTVLVSCHWLPSIYQTLLSDKEGGNSSPIATSCVGHRHPSRLASLRSNNVL